MAERLHLHIYQDLATPHNNDLLQALRRRSDVNVTAWYDRRVDPMLPWGAALDEEADARFLDNWRARLAFVAALLRPGAARFVFVGYATVWSRIGVLLHWLLRRNFGYWTDHPVDRPMSAMHQFTRALATVLLRSRARPLLVVGTHTRERFLRLGFRSDVVHDLPICVAAPEGPGVLESPSSVRERLGIGEGMALVVAASRLTRDKGFDVLVEAWAELPATIRESARLVIVGDGPEGHALERDIASRGLGRSITLVPWQEPRGYWSILAAADIFVHPARFDAFGGGTLYSMAFGVPVVGSTGAGVVAERVDAEVSGLKVPPDDAAAMSQAVERLLLDREFRTRLAAGALATARAWGPETGAEILLTAMRGVAAKRLDLRGGLAHGNATYRMRPLEARDIEELRVWKNSNREFFHYKEIIDAEQQRRWFEGFSRALDRQIVVLEREGLLIACVGYRELDSQRVELFNLLRAVDRHGGDGVMRAFFDLTVGRLCRLGVRRIELDVVTNNARGVRWYERQGFTCVERLSTHVRLVKDLDSLDQPVTE